MEMHLAPAICAVGGIMVDADRQVPPLACREIVDADDAQDNESAEQMRWHLQAG